MSLFYIAQRYVPARVENDRDWPGHVIRFDERYDFCYVAKTKPELIELIKGYYKYPGRKPEHDPRVIETKELEDKSRQIITILCNEYKTQYLITEYQIDSEDSLPIRYASTVTHPNFPDSGIVVSVEGDNAKVMFKDGFIKDPFSKVVPYEDKSVSLPISSLQKYGDLVFLVIETGNAYFDLEYPNFIAVGSSLEELKRNMISYAERRLSYVEGRDKTYEVETYDDNFVHKGGSHYQGYDSYEKGYWKRHINLVTIMKYKQESDVEYTYTCNYSCSTLTM